MCIRDRLYLDALNQPDRDREEKKPAMLNVALPKGRLGDKVYNMLASVGYGCPENYNDTRKLVVENPEAGIRYFLVKPSDCLLYTSGLVETIRAADYRRKKKQKEIDELQMKIFSSRK